MNKSCRSWQDSNLQSSDSKSDALSIAPQDHEYSTGWNSLYFATVHLKMSLAYTISIINERMLKEMGQDSSVYWLRNEADPEKPCYVQAQHSTCIPR